MILDESLRSAFFGGGAGNTRAANPWAGARAGAT